MRLLSTLLWIVLFLVMLVFSVANTHIAEIRLFGQTFAAPLVLLLLMFFAAGVVVGLLAALPSWFRGRREITRLARELAAQRGASPTTAAAAGAATPPSPAATLPDFPLVQPPVR